MGSKFEKLVHVVKSCYVKINGKDFPVASFSLDLSDNSIPMLRLTIDPYHKYSGTEPNEDVRKAQEAAVGKFVKTYESIQNVVGDKSLRKAQFVFEIEGGDERQSFELKDWLVIQGGITDISTGGSFTVDVQICHPAYELTESTSNLAGFVSEMKVDTTKFSSASDVLDGIKKAQKEYYKQANATVAQPLKSNKHFIRMKEKYQKMMTAFDTRLRWDNKDGTWPTVPFSTFAKQIKQAIWGYIVAMGAANPYTWLIDDMCPEWFMTLKPHYWEPQLVLSAFKPWGDIKVTFYDSDISGMSLPAVDPMPRAGVYTLFNLPTIDGASYFEDPDGAKQAMSDIAAWTEDKLEGDILPTQPPSWLIAALLDLETDTNGLVTPGDGFTDNANTPSNSVDSNEGQGVAGIQDIERYRDKLEYLCKEVFVERFRDNYNATFTTRLMVRHRKSMLPDNYVIPGYVYELRSDPAWSSNSGTAGSIGKFLKFYCTRVVHYVDCQSGDAHTELAGTYVRSSKYPPKAEAIPNGKASNYLYE